MLHNKFQEVGYMKQLKAPNKRELAAVPRTHRVIVICKDDHIGLWMVRSLGQNGLKVLSLCTTPNGLAAYSRYSSGVWTACSDPPSKEFVAQVKQLARQFDVGSIMPLSESTHLALMQERDTLEPEIHLFSPPDEAFAKATDKDYMHNLCLRLGVPVAKGMTLDKLMDAGGETLRFPLVLRTRRQNGVNAKHRAPWGRIEYAHNVAQLRELARLVEGYADNIIVQEFYPGVTDQAQVVMHRGQAFVSEFMAETHIPLAGGVSVQRITLWRESLIRDSIRLLESIGWEGAAGVQFHYDHQTDSYIFIEINPRFVGGLPTMVRAGFHGPFLLWQSHFDPDNLKQPSYRLGLRSRGFRPSLAWLKAMNRGDRLPPGEKRLSKFGATARFFWNFGPWTKEDTFLASDVGPFLAECRRFLKIPSFNNRLESQPAK
jgi:predicted ATP-grasp superfamily ATP-dependent carboligase